MTKATTSAVDFMAALGGKSEAFTVEGITVELRSLEFQEVQALNTQYGAEPAELALRMVAAGLVTPPLTVDELRKVRPGPLAAIAQRISQLSGLEAQAANQPPLAGTGS